MRAFLVVGLLSAAVAAFEAGADLFRREADFRPGVLEFDKGDTHYVILPNLAGQFGTKNSTGGKAEKRGVKTERSVLDVLLNKRQYCPTGYGYCSSFGECCPVTDDCCSYGYCIDPEDTCCPNGSCDPGEGCCGYYHCYPAGQVCCGDESWCPAGNNCYTDPDYATDVCCTNNKCTAYVSGGVTYSRTTLSTYTTPPTHTTTAPPVTTTAGGTYDYYFFTITYYYYYYYWYEIDISISVVTSSRVTDYSYVDVTATDASDATSSFKAISSTFAPSTPAAATSLESLAGKTTTEAPATFGGGGSSTSMPPATFGGGSSSSSSSSSSSTKTTSKTTTSSKTSTTTTVTPTTTPTSQVAGSGAARGPLLTSGRAIGLWLAVGAATGVLMVLL